MNRVVRVVWLLLFWWNIGFIVRHSGWTRHQIQLDLVLIGSLSIILYMFTDDPNSFTSFMIILMYIIKAFVAEQRVEDMEVVMRILSGEAAVSLFLLLIGIFQIVSGESIFIWGNYLIISAIYILPYPQDEFAWMVYEQELREWEDAL